MGLRQALANYLLKEYKLGGTRAGGLQFVDLQAAPTWNYQSYLKAYGEIGWLYACVNVIAQAVAKVPWHLYEEAADGELSEIEEHPVLDLLDSVNPFQSFYQFLYLGTMYKLLVGEEFWQINFAGTLPAEMWLAPPAFMSVIPDQTNYISHYEFRRSGMDRPVSFTIDEIIHVKTPNPYNEFRGLSPAQALTIDLDSERYAQRYQQKLFFNDATPGFVLEYPAENLPPQDVRKELQIEWDERFRGVSNARRTAFLWGAKANTLTMSNKDMDFEALRRFNRDAILGAYHVPRSIIGITEDVNRANADAAQYTFAQYCVLPELTELRESMNRELVTFFGDNLYLDFENPVPEDKVANINNAVALYKNGIAKLNEARTMVDLDPVDDLEGEEFYKQPAPQMLPGQQGNNEIPPEKGYRILEISHPKALSLSLRRTGKPTGKPT
jgi:HK97 family phage portal protein